MIVLYLKSLNKVIRDPEAKLFEELGYDDLLWIDLLKPTPKERKIVEEFMEIDLQTRQQIEEIETSSRYSESENAIICNSSFIVTSKDDVAGYRSEPVSFIISEGVLVSVRGVELKTFEEASRKLQINYRSYTTGYHVLISILEARIDLDADMVETLSKQIATVNVSDKDVDKSVDKEILILINNLQESMMLLRETIFDRQRLLSGIQRSERFPNDIYPRVAIMLKDIGSLLNHADFSFERLEFLQDTFMGLINIEQNKIIKMFTVLSVVFMPPTLIASIYGMNFRIMPELDWEQGYLYSIILMIASMAIIIGFFKRKKWL
ncbi:Magnesium and cobalt transport protein CorA [Mucinivorans hirudinis]|uniref:Magnesium transport protein CorA n=1 Tax=Mucinivorans hirudinis TaxID=1433126 RepID=A0A060R9U4_9BACT|nr:Magnesium and cobalt transport protein CorA [Mucinivorans hirudinis]